MTTRGGRTSRHCRAGISGREGRRFEEDARSTRGTGGEGKASRRREAPSLPGRSGGPGASSSTRRRSAATEGEAAERWGCASPSSTRGRSRGPAERVRAARDRRPRPAASRGLQMRLWTTVAAAGRRDPRRPRRPVGAHGRSIPAAPQLPRGSNGPLACRMDDPSAPVLNPFVAFRNDHSGYRLNAARARWQALLRTTPKVQRPCPGAGRPIAFS
jgi:hypothetical protein